MCCERQYVHLRKVGAFDARLSRLLADKHQPRIGFERGRDPAYSSAAVSGNRGNF